MRGYNSRIGVRLARSEMKWLEREDDTVRVELLRAVKLGRKSLILNKALLKIRTSRFRCKLAKK